MNVIELILTNSTPLTFIQFDSTILLLRTDTPENTPNYTQNGLGYGMGKMVIGIIRALFKGKTFCT